MTPQQTTWILVTGASGFVGQHLVSHLRANNVSIILLGRDASRISDIFGQDAQLYCTSYQYDAAGNLDIASILPAASTVTSVIHLAGVAHQKDATQVDYQSGIIDFSKSIFNGVTQWASQNKQHVAIMNLSSIAARDYENSARHHLVYYGQAKEAVETDLTAQCGPYISAVSWRAPAIWAANAPGPFRLITAFINCGLPLPFASVKTKRAYISVQNLVAQLYTTANSLTAAPTNKHHIIEVADGQFSLGQVCKMLGQAHGRKTRIWHVPSWILKRGLTVVGKRDLVDQIFTPLTVSQTDLQTLLNRDN